jgi:hypothetical protein
MVDRLGQQQVKKARQMIDPSEGLMVLTAPDQDHTRMRSSALCLQLV